MQGLAGFSFVRIFSETNHESGSATQPTLPSDIVLSAVGNLDEIVLSGLH
jgi:hypothetical protein